MRARLAATTISTTKLSKIKGTSIRISTSYRRCTRQIRLTLGRTSVLESIRLKINIACTRRFQELTHYKISIAATAPAQDPAYHLCRVEGAKRTTLQVPRFHHLKYQTDQSRTISMVVIGRASYHPSILVVI